MNTLLGRILLASLGWCIVLAVLVASKLAPRHFQRSA